MPLALRPGLALAVWFATVPAWPAADPPAPPDRAAHLSREAQQLYAVAILHQRRDQLVTAAQLLEEAVRLDPTAVPPRRSLLSVYRALGRVEDLLAGCQKLVELAPDDAEAWHFYAEQLQDQNQPREAAKALARGLACPSVKDQPTLRAKLCRRLADLRERDQDWTSAESAYRQLGEAIAARRAALVATGLPTDELDRPAARAAEGVGRACMAARRYGPAAEAFRQALAFARTDPTEATRLRWPLAEACAADGRDGEALGHLEKYLDARPRHVEAYRRKVELLGRLGRGTEVLDELRRDAGRQPAFFDLQLLLAEQYARRGQARQAEALYERLARDHPTPEVYAGLFGVMGAGRAAAILNLLDDALVAADAAKKKEPGAAAGAAVRARAMTAALRKDAALVRALVREAMEETRDRKERALAFDTLHVLAGLAARSRDRREAELLFRECLRRLRREIPLGREYDVYSGLLQILWQDHKYEEIVRLCQDGLRSTKLTERVLFHYHLTLALVELGRIEEAIAVADKAVDSAGARQKVLVRCRKAEVLRRAGRSEQALAECRALLKEYKDEEKRTQVRYTLAHVYASLGKHAEAEEQLRLVLAADPEDATAHNDLGYQLADRGRKLEEAEALIRRAIALDREQRSESADDEPDNAAFLDSLGWVRFRRGDPAEARTWLEKAVQLSTGADDPTVWDHLGDVTFRLNDVGAARKAWENAARLYGVERRGREEGRLDEVKRKLKLLERRRGDAPRR